MPAKSPSTFVIAITRRGWWLCWLAAGAVLMVASVGWLAQSLPDTFVWFFGLVTHWQWLFLTIGLLAASAAVICGRLNALLDAAPQRVTQVVGVTWGWCLARSLVSAVQPAHRSTS